jgi:hypothetical protein
LTGVYSQETSPDAMSPGLGVPFIGPAICSISAVVMSVQGSGIAGAALKTCPDPLEKNATTPYNENFRNQRPNDFNWSPLNTNHFRPRLV